MDEHVECSHWSWLSNFIEWFSWRPQFMPAFDFLNNYFIPGVLYHIREVPISGIMNYDFKNTSFLFEEFKMT